MLENSLHVTRGFCVFASSLRIPKEMSLHHQSLKILGVIFIYRLSFFLHFKLESFPRFISDLNTSPNQIEKRPPRYSCEVMKPHDPDLSILTWRGFICTKFIHVEFVTPKLLLLACVENLSSDSNGTYAMIIGANDVLPFVTISFQRKYFGQHKHSSPSGIFT